MKTTGLFGDRRAFQWLLIFGWLVPICVGWLHQTRPGVHRPLSHLVQTGFARNRDSVLALENTRVSVWGYIDYGNGNCEGVVRAPSLGWATEPVDEWYFDIKASARDGTGDGVRVFVPKGDAGKLTFLRLAERFRDDAATKVWVTGRLATFDAPTNARARSAGIQFCAENAEDVRFSDPESSE